MKKRKLNVRLLRRIQRHILKEPRRFLMEHWGFRVKSQEEWTQQTTWADDASSRMPPCKTAACIAGTANLLTGGKLNAPDRAAKILGLPLHSTCSRKGIDHPVFQVQGWPESYARRYRNATTPKQRAKIACARIDHLILTGE